MKFKFELKIPGSRPRDGAIGVGVTGKMLMKFVAAAGEWDIVGGSSQDLADVPMDAEWVLFEEMISLESHEELVRNLLVLYSNGHSADSVKTYISVIRALGVDRPEFNQIMESAGSEQSGHSGGPRHMFDMTVTVTE